MQLGRQGVSCQDYSNGRPESFEQGRARVLNGNHRRLRYQELSLVQSLAAYIHIIRFQEEFLDFGFILYYIQKLQYFHSESSVRSNLDHLARQFFRHGKTSYVRDYEEEKRLHESYGGIIRDLNERREREKAEWINSENARKQEVAKMAQDWEAEKQRMKIDAENKAKEERELFTSLQGQISDQKKKLEADLANAKALNEAKLREINNRVAADDNKKKDLEDQMNKLKKEDAAKKKELQDLLTKHEEDRAKFAKERKADQEKVDAEIKQAKTQREELEKRMKKVQEEEEERKEREKKSIAAQKEFIKKRDEEVRVEKEKTEKALKEKEKAEDDLKKGIRPEMIPTEEDRQRVKKELRYTDDHFHFAVCGQAGSGKSSLINALRGMRNKDPMAAKTGAVETTQLIGRYPDMDKRPPRAWIVWYDIPGGGTTNIPDWQYFNDQGLFIFDIIILAIGDRLSILDIWILKNCRRFDIPCFVVRSKSDMHIRNVARNELEYDSDDEDQDHKSIREEARKMYIEQTQKSFGSIIAKEKLPPQRTYIVSAPTMCNCVNGKAKNTIDEVDLIQDLLKAAYARVDIQMAQ